MTERRPSFLSPRFTLRTLLVVMLVAGALGPFGWLRWQAYQRGKMAQALEEERQRKYAESVALLHEIQKAQRDIRGGLVSGEQQARIRRILEGEPAEASSVSAGEAEFGDE